MTVLLVLAFLVLAIAIDYAMVRRRLAREKVAHAPAPPPPVEPAWVAGYLMPEELHYHRGHTWARPLDTRAVLVGLDDFARHLLGPAARVRLPSVGRRLVQGGPAFALGLDGKVAELVSPVAGEVVEVNGEVLRRPSLATDDPYGRGWILKIAPHDLATDLRNLLSGRLARRWMEDSREALELRLMALQGSVLQDGGEPAADFARRLPPSDWARLVGEFFLT